MHDPHITTHSNATASRRAGLPRLRTLLVATAIVASLAAFAAHASPKAHEGCGHRAAAAHDGGGLHAMGPRLNGRMLERIGASAEQREQIGRIMASARADLKAGREQGMALRDQAAALFARPEVDAAALEALRKDMLQRQDQASQRMTQAMLEAARVLTPEQRLKLTEAMKASPGKGGHHHGPERRRGEHGQHGERKSS